MTGILRERHGDRLLKVYGQRPPHLAAAFDASVAMRADAPAVIDGGRRLSYRELDAMSSAVAGGLAADGVQRGDRVAVILPNGLEAAVLAIALARLGAILVPLGMNLRMAEIRHVFDDATPAAVIFDVSRARELPAPGVSGPVIERRFGVGGDASGADRRFADLMRGTGAPHPVKVTEDDPYAILYTSGTTGRPKGAILTHLNVIHSALHWRNVHQLRPEEVAVLAIPWNHVAGLCGVLLPMLTVGASLVMMREFRAATFLELVEAERITHALLVPAMYGLCLLEPDLREIARELSADTQRPRNSR